MDLQEARQAMLRETPFTTSERRTGAEQQAPQQGNTLRAE
jgi:hypothetical protein